MVGDETRTGCIKGVSQGGNHGAGSTSARLRNAGAGTIPSMTDAETIGVAVRRIRERKGLELEAVEAAASLAEGRLASLENGRYHARWGDLRGLAKAMDVPLEDINAEAEVVEEAA